MEGPSYRECGEFCELLNAQQTRARGIFDPNGLTHDVSRFEADGSSAHRVFRSAALELWYRRYID